MTHPYTLTSLLALPTVDYISGENADAHRMVCADMGNAVITNPTSKRPIAAVEALANCLGVAVINENTQATLATHLFDTHNGNSQDAANLRKIIDVMRRKPSEKLSLFFIGAAFDTATSQSKPTVKSEWIERMEAIVAELNQHQNIEVKGFDVGDKPHPTGFAVQWRGKDYQLARLGNLVADVYEAANAPAFPSVLFTPQPKTSEKQNDPPLLAWDGRLPEHQTQRIPAKNASQAPSK